MTKASQALVYSVPEGFIPEPQEYKHKERSDAVACQRRVITALVQGLT